MDGNPIPMPVLSTTTDTAGLPKTPPKTEISNMTGNLVNRVDETNPATTPRVNTITRPPIKSVSMRHNTLPNPSPSQLIPPINPRTTLTKQEEAVLCFLQACTHSAARQVQGQTTFQIQT